MGQEQKITDPIGIAEAADLLGCTTSHVRLLLRTGKLTGRKTSPRVWILSKKSVCYFAKHRPKLGRPPLQ